LNSILSLLAPIFSIFRLDGLYFWQGKGLGKGLVVLLFLPSFPLCLSLKEPSFVAKVANDNLGGRVIDLQLLGYHIDRLRFFKNHLNQLGSQLNY